MFVNLFIGFVLKLISEYDIYSGSATRAAGAARYARARNISTICEGGRKKRPMIWCN